MLLTAELSHNDIITAIKQYVERNTSRRAISVKLRNSGLFVEGDALFMATVTTDNNTLNNLNQHLR